MMHLRFDFTCDVTGCPNNQVMDGRHPTVPKARLDEAQHALGLLNMLRDGWVFEGEGEDTRHYCPLHREPATRGTPHPSLEKTQ